MNKCKILFKKKRTRRLSAEECVIPFLIIYIAVLFWGCSSHSSFRVDASQADLTAIVGKWNGSFKNNDSQWSGTIVFSMEAGKDTAYGNVIMTPRGSTEPYYLAISGERVTIQPRLDRFLTVSFVRVEGGAISGTLTPYFDPENSQVVTITFYGRIVDDAIVGTYKSSSANVFGERTGTWKVTREK